MPNLSVFKFQSASEIRVQIINAEPWFCLKDVCSVLEITNVSQLKNQVDVKGVCKTYTPTKGGNQALTYVNEPNLYRVIFRSNKPEAIQFQDWVFNEVIPIIRKTGSYQKPAQTPSTNSMFTNLNDGRYLLLVRKGETFIRDIATCSVIDTEVTGQIARDLIAVQKANMEMAKRLAILSGDQSESLLENPLDVQISDGKFKPVQHVQNEPVQPTPLQPVKQDLDLIRTDRVALAKAYLNVVGQHGDGYRLARELGVHQSTGHKIMTSLYRIGNREVYDNATP